MTKGEGKKFVNKRKARSVAEISGMSMKFSSDDGCALTSFFNKMV